MKADVKLVAETSTGPIVMVDDEELDVDAVRRGLEKSRLPNAFLSFSDGPPFLAYLQAIKRGEGDFPALVLLDMNMPLMTGIEVLKKMREDQSFRDIPVVAMLTSSTHDQDRRSAAKSGAHDYLVKPLDYNEYIDFFEGLFVAR